MILGVIMDSDSTVYKFVKWDTCINKIFKDYSKGIVRLKYSKPCEFDDIFEMRHIMPDHKAAEWVQKTSNQQNQIAANEMSVFAQVYNGLLPNLRIDDAVEKLLDDRFITCFSSDWNIPLMWSFYADKYAGCAIGFKKKSFLKGGHNSLQQVRYISGNPHVEMSRAEEIAAWRMTTKFSDWSWEQEWRDILTSEELDNPDDKLKNFVPDDVTEIILGIRVLQANGEKEQAFNELTKLGIECEKIKYLEKDFFNEMGLSLDTFA